MQGPLTLGSVLHVLHQPLKQRTKRKNCALGTDSKFHSKAWADVLEIKVPYKSACKRMEAPMYGSHPL